MENQKQWYIVYTHTGHEQKVSEVLKKKRIECFCPLNKTAHLVHSKHKPGYQPLFSNWVFVYIALAEHSVLVQTEGVINFVYWHKQPIAVSHDEMYALKHFLNNYEEVSVDRTKIDVNHNDKFIHEYITGNKVEQYDVVKIYFPFLGYTITAQEKKTNIKVISVATLQNTTNNIYADI